MVLKSHLECKSAGIGPPIFRLVLSWRSIRQILMPSLTGIMVMKALAIDPHSHWFSNIEPQYIVSGVPLPGLLLHITITESAVYHISVGL